MKNIQIALGALLAATFLFACNSGIAGVDPVDSDSSSSPLSLAVELEEERHNLVLNDGVRWQMDEHTRISFANMSATFLDSNHKSLDEAGLKKVADGLQAGINELIQGCTMVGEAHNQLHAYLTRYMPAVATLSASGQMQDADEVGYYLAVYGEFFE